MAHQPTVTVADPARLPADAGVRHYGELGEETRTYLEWVAGGRAGDGGSSRPTLSAGDVVVLTDNYPVV